MRIRGKLCAARASRFLEDQTASKDKEKEKEKPATTDTQPVCIVESFSFF